VDRRDRRNAVLVVEDLEDIENGRGEEIEALVAVRSHSGPLPSPDVLKGYAEIDDDLVPRIVAMAEKEQAQQHSLQDRALTARVSDAAAMRRIETRGQLFALVIGVVAIIIGGVVSIYASHAGQWGGQLTGGLIGGGGIVSLVSAFIMGRSQAAKRGRIEKTSRWDAGTQPRVQDEPTRT
jgi:uncharacterized membrane protein